MDELLYLALTYLFAAIPFGVVVTTLYGGDADLRASGSGNIGTTNVARVFGWQVAVPVLVFDVAKGFLPVAASWLLWPAWWPWFGSAVAIVAFVGHCWPVYLEFRGGKGVATGAGAFLALAPLPAAIAAAVWGAVLAVSGRSSLASLLATGVLLGAVLWLAPAVAPVAVLLAAGIAFRHLANLGRLWRGEEDAVVRPAVKWGRGAAPTGEDALAEDPAGTRSGTDAWRAAPDADHTV